jgi:F-type H+-transporting ATPase subunit delta
MKIPKQAQRDAKALFAACQVNGRLDENRARRTVEELLARKPRGYLAILSHFQRLVKLDVIRRAVLVESAAELSSEQEGQLKAQLSARYGQGLNFSFMRNPALLGGVRIKVGSDVFDGSVQGRLSALERSFEVV